MCQWTPRVAVVAAEASRPQHQGDRVLACWPRPCRSVPCSDEPDRAAIRDERLRIVAADAASRWSAAGRRGRVVGSGSGSVPVRTSISWRVPLSLALTQPAEAGLDVALGAGDLPVRRHVVGLQLGVHRVAAAAEVGRLRPGRRRPRRRRSSPSAKPPMRTSTTKAPRLLWSGGCGMRRDGCEEPTEAPADACRGTPTGRRSRLGAEAGPTRACHRHECRLGWRPGVAPRRGGSLGLVRSRSPSDALDGGLSMLGMSRLPIFIVWRTPSRSMKIVRRDPQDPVLRGDRGVRVGDLQVVEPDAVGVVGHGRPASSEMKTARTTQPIGRRTSRRSP